ncbi:hypothetical protein SLEP1_g888 [Rubroshorea leprosula]|uniref:K Homology domain-containing protein n=1 Tax=Rubroshorea leprosula TaxID=152421 RepID=A0AAV5HIS7_9ROSI|nr:hypothetical protein SLEP1_g888 [Rubroshorea leprosula]
MAGEDFDQSNAGGMPELTQPLHAQEPENNSGGGEGKKWPGWPGENVFRMLVPVQKVGVIIGCKGEFVKKIAEQTRARIKVLDGPPGISERAKCLFWDMVPSSFALYLVLVSAKEKPDVPVPPAMDALLRVHKRIVDLDVDLASETTDAGNTVITRVLVADNQARSLIGKQGSTIKSIKEASNCSVRILGSEHLPPFALQNDSVVEIQGETAAVHKAVELIASHLRKYLVDRSIIGVFEMQVLVYVLHDNIKVQTGLQCSSISCQMQMPKARANQITPMPESWVPLGFDMNPDDQPGFGPNTLFIQPPTQFGNYYANHGQPSFDMYPHQDPTAYGRDHSTGGHLSNVQAQESVVTKVTKNMQISLSYADAVIGPSGANISYIRRASGAAIAVLETRGVPGEMTVEINGSASQVLAAQQMIQNFMAEAESPVHKPGGGSIHPDYGAGDYGALHGTNYGC